jgi:hypothetical protein
MKKQINTPLNSIEFVKAWKKFIDQFTTKNKNWQKAYKKSGAWSKIF